MSVLIDPMILHPSLCNEEAQRTKYQSTERVAGLSEKKLARVMLSKTKEQF